MAQGDSQAPEKTENLLKLGHEELPLEYEAEFSPLKTVTMPKKVYGKNIKFSELKTNTIAVLSDFDAKSGNMVGPFLL